MSEYCFGVQRRMVVEGRKIVTVDRKIKMPQTGVFSKSGKRTVRHNQMQLYMRCNL